MPEKQSWISRDSDGQLHLSVKSRNHLIGFVAVYVLFFGAFFDHANLWQPGRLLQCDNPHVAEAKAWLNGRPDIPERLWDSALVDGRFFNVFPPMMTFVSMACLLVSPDGVPFMLLTWLFVLPIPGLAYVLFVRRSESVFGGVLMASVFVLGTSEFVILCRVTQSAQACQLNNAVTQLGLLIFLIDYYGRRRFWVGGVGQLVMGWARNTMLALLLPYLWGLWDLGGSGRKLGGAAICALLLAVPAVVNMVRFDRPSETGFVRIYEGRTDDPSDWLAQDGSRALFSMSYFPRNMYWMNLGFPEIVQKGTGWRWKLPVKSTGIWWTTPVLLYLFFDTRRIWAERANRWLMAAVVPILIAIMTYHNMGYSQRGYNRFSLDFLLVLLALVAPYAMQGKRRYLTILFGIWSVAYFRWIVY